MDRYLLDLYRQSTSDDSADIYTTKRLLDDAVVLLELAVQFSNCTRYQQDALRISFDFLHQWRELYLCGVRSGNPVFYRKLFNLEKVSVAMTDANANPPCGGEHG